MSLLKPSAANGTAANGTEPSADARSETSGIPTDPKSAATAPDSPPSALTNWRHPNSTGWTLESLFFEGDDYYRDVLSGMDAAQKTLIFETYIYDDDEVGREFEAVLMRAALRGVKTRVLVDGIGAGTWASRRGALLENAGVEIRVYHPVRLVSLLKRLMIDLGIRRHMVSRSSSIFARMNRRNHRKMIIVDGKTAWVGSLNISSVHSAKSIGALAWRDTASKVEGEELSDLEIGFEYAWTRSSALDGHRRWSETLLHPGHPKVRFHLVRANFTLQLRRRGFAQFIRRIRKAQKRIWITNAYLAPAAPVVRALKRASARGVDVRILLPRKSDVFFMPWVAGSYYGTFLKSRIKIYEYLPRFLHAKSILIDDWVSVGTSNLNRRSLLRDFEVDVVLRKKDSVRTLAEQFERDLAHATEVRTAPTGLKAFLGRLIIYLMKEYI